MILQKISSIIVPSTPRNVVAVSAACTFVGAVARACVDPLLPPGVPYPTFWVAADAAAITAGWRAGALTVALSAVVGWYFWMIPRYSFDLPHGAVPVISIFIVLASLQVFIAELMREALLRMQKMHAERDLVVRELVHRIRNHFALFNSIAMQTLRTAKDLPSASDALQDRLKALMLGLDLAATTGDQALEMSALVSMAVVPLAPTPARLHVKAVAAEVSREQVHAIALVLHELGTNAIKHGAWSGPEGIVRVDVATKAGAIVLLWTEECPAKPLQSDKKGFGSTLIQRAIPDAIVEFREGPPFQVAITLSA